MSIVYIVEQLHHDVSSGRISPGYYPKFPTFPTLEEAEQFVVDNNAHLMLDKDGMNDLCEQLIREKEI